MGSLADPTTDVPSKFTADFEGSNETGGRYPKLMLFLFFSLSQPGSSAQLLPKSY